MEQEKIVVVDDQNTEAAISTSVENVQAKITKNDQESKKRDSKDPKKVEAGRLSAISRAAKKRQREKLGGEEEEKNSSSSWNPSSILYFGIPSIFLMGMFFWTLKKKEPVVEYKPVKEEQQQQSERLPDAKKKTDRKLISLFD